MNGLEASHGHSLVLRRSWPCREQREAIVFAECDGLWIEFFIAVVAFYCCFNHATTELMLAGYKPAPRVIGSLAIYTCSGTTNGALYSRFKNRFACSEPSPTKRSETGSMRSILLSFRFAWLMSME